MDQGLGYIGDAIFGAIAANVFQIYRDHVKDKKHKRDDRIRSINDLRGIKHIMLQSKASYYSAFIQSVTLQSGAHIFAIRNINYDEIIGQRIYNASPEMEDAQQYINRTIDGYLDNSTELKEHLRQKQRYEDLQLEMARNDERFWKTIGRISILFLNNNEVKNYINDIKNADHKLGKLEDEVIASMDPIRDEIQTTPGRISNNSERNQWTDRKKTELGEWSSVQITTLKSGIDAFDTKIDDLLNHLEHFQDTYSRYCKFFCSDRSCPMRPKLDENAK